MDPIDQVLLKYSINPCIRRIHILILNNSLFHFDNVSVEEMETDIGKLNPSKATTFKNIPPKTVKDSSEICAESLQIIFNDGIENFSLPDKRKYADISSLHKTEAKTLQKDYRPIKVLPTVSKVLRELWAGR